MTTSEVDRLWPGGDQVLALVKDLILAMQDNARSRVVETVSQLRTHLEEARRRPDLSRGRAMALDHLLDALGPAGSEERLPFDWYRRASTYFLAAQRVFSLEPVDEGTLAWAEGVLDAQGTLHEKEGPPVYWYTQSGKGDHAPAVLVNAPGCPKDGTPFVLLPDGTLLACADKAAAETVRDVLRHLVHWQVRS